MIGHNNEYACRFYECMQRLKNLGLKGEIALNAGLVMVSTSDKGSAQTFRKAIKTACERAGVKRIETRPRKGFWVFTIFCEV